MMRKQILSASLVAASLVAGLTACDNDKLTSVNANPNQPEQVESSSLFTNATIGALARIRGSSFEHGLSGLWSQHYAEIQYAEADLNQPRNATTEAHWVGFYTGPLADYNQILTQSASSQNLSARARDARLHDPDDDGFLGRHPADGSRSGCHELHAEVRCAVGGVRHHLRVRSAAPRRS